MFEEFDKWFNKKYPYPTSLMVTPDQKEHLRDAFIAGMKSAGPRMTKEEIDNLDLFLKELYGSCYDGAKLKLNRKE